MLRRALAGALVAWAVAGWGGAARADPAAVVNMTNYSFQPATITVTAGDAVTWVNDDQAPHNVVSSDGPLPIQSPDLSKGDSWTFVPSDPGTYHYICSIHPSMRATLVVSAPVMSAPAAALPPVSSAAPPATTAAPAPTAPVATSMAAAPARSIAPVAAPVAFRGAPDGLARIHSLLLVGMAVALVVGLCLLLLGAGSRSGAPG